MAVVAVVAEAVTAVAISPAGAVWRLLEFGQKKRQTHSDTLKQEKRLALLCTVG